MKIFIFDTETTWFINKKNPNLDVQPYIIQFAWILWELKNWVFKEITRINQLIKPKIPIPYVSSQVHQIYDIDVQNAPNIEDKIEEFLTFINESDIVIWHNIEYDENMIKLELKRLWKEYLYKPKQTICTMQNTIDFCALKGKGDRYKYPKLWELYKKLFWEYFLWAHDAIVDVEATLKIVIELFNKDILTIKKKQHEVLSLF